MKAKSTGVFSSRTVQVGVYRYEKPEQASVDYKGKGCLDYMLFKLS